MKKSTFTISELAREFAATPRAIRFYEDEGLLSPAREGLNRIYSSRDRIRLKLILLCKRLGFSLGEIRELFDIYDAASRERPQLLQVLAFLSEKRARLEQQRGDIETFLSELRAFETRCLENLAREERRGSGGLHATGGLTKPADA